MLVSAVNPGFTYKELEMLKARKLMMEKIHTDINILPQEVWYSPHLFVQSILVSKKGLGLSSIYRFVYTFKDIGQ